MAKRYQTLESWIHEALTDQDKLDDTGKPQPCTALSLVHVNQHGIGSKEVHTKPLVGKTHTAKELSREFTAKAEGYAQDMPGITTFVLQAYYGGSEPRANHPFKLYDGEVNHGDGYTLSETPDTKGQTAQLMRHLETKERLLVGFIQGTVAGWHNERAALQAEVNDAYKIVREMMMTMQDNQHKHRMEEMAYMRTSQERQDLLRLAPAMVNTLTGREVIPQATADTALIDNLARKVKPEAVEMLVSTGILPQELAGALIARIAQVHEQDKVRADELRRMKPADSDEFTEVGGEKNGAALQTTKAS